MIRAGPPLCATAASWSGARSASIGASTSGVRSPCSTRTRCTSAPSTPGDRADARSAVDPRRRAVGQDDVERTALASRRAAPLRRAGPHTRRLAAAVVVVRASEEVAAARARTRTPGASSYGGRRVGLGRAQRVRRRRRGRRPRARAAPTPRASRSTTAAGLAQHRVVDRDALGVAPALGHGSAGVDDDTPPEAAARVVGHGAHHRRRVRQQSPVARGPSSRTIRRWQASAAVPSSTSCSSSSSTRCSACGRTSPTTSCSGSRCPARGVYGGAPSAERRHRSATVTGSSTSTPTSTKPPTTGTAIVPMTTIGWLMWHIGSMPGRLAELDFLDGAVDFASGWTSPYRSAHPVFTSANDAVTRMRDGWRASTARSSDRPTSGSSRCTTSASRADQRCTARRRPAQRDQPPRRADLPAARPLPLGRRQTMT